MTCENGLIDLKSHRRLLKRFAGDLEAASDSGKAGRWIDKARESLSTFWHYEISSVDDRPITVAKIISALFYFLVGILAARLISSVFGGRFLKRFGLNEGARHAVQSITFYSLCVIFTMLTLEMVNLPFAAFTFLGGAVVIAFGFGTQNILNNFISGLILLAEQPIRVGDLVEIDGHCGTVEKIGARSTCVKTMANHEIIVPNSSLLENKVTNLTLSNNLIQTAIGITLSPTLHADEVRDILYEAALSHPMVLRTPEPVVLFKEFSTSAISFELHFWIKLESIMARSVAESEVRAKINRSLGNTDAATTTVNSAKSAA
jgi:potassium efflux system protein